MSKQSMIAEILPQFDKLGIPHQEGLGTDITIDCDFLDASWKTGNRKIKYDASIYFDESQQTVFMWELTKDTGAGISFGTSSESSFQSGTTLYRKVKSIQYGPDGKAYEFEIDLGAIPKTVKEAAKADGWKFKIVLKREKALNPFANAQTLQQPQDPQNQESPTGVQNSSEVQNQNNIQKPKVKMKSSPMFYLPLIILIVITIVFFDLNRVSPVGWGFGIILFLLLYLTRGKILKAGCLTKIIIWIAVFGILFAIYALSFNSVNAL